MDRMELHELNEDCEPLQEGETLHSYRLAIWADDKVYYLLVPVSVGAEQLQVAFQRFADDFSK